MNIITPELVKRYLSAAGWTVEQIGDRLAWTRPDGSATWTGLGEAPHELRSGTLKEYEEHGARLGMLAAAEMLLAHSSATTSLNEGAAFLRVRDALERSARVFIETAGLDPKAWEKARET